MGGSPFTEAGVFLVSTLFSLYILLVMLRFLLQWLRADFYNPISQFLVKVTQPPLQPLRRFIPGFRGVDVASLVLLLALQYVEITLVGGMTGRGPSPAGTVVVAVASLMGLGLNVFFWAIFIQIVISWVNPGLHNPITSILHTLTHPLLSRARRLLPPIQGFDLSPIPVLIGLKLAEILVVKPFAGLAIGI